MVTPERIDLVEKLFDPYGNLDGFAPALELVAHARELQGFLLDLTEHMASPEGAAKVQAHYQMQRRAEALRAKICPPRRLINEMRN